MNSVNKIPLIEVHRRLNSRAGRLIFPQDFETLLHCWRKHARKTRAGKDGWLSLKNTIDFLEYAY